MDLEEPVDTVTRPSVSTVSNDEQTWPTPRFHSSESLLLHPGGDHLQLDKIIQKKLSLTQASPVDDQMNHLEQAILVQQNRSESYRSDSEVTEDAAVDEPQKLVIGIRRKKDGRKKSPTVLSIALGDDGSLQLTQGSESTDASTAENGVQQKESSPGDKKVKFQDDGLDTSEESSRSQGAAKKGKKRNKSGSDEDDRGRRRGKKRDRDSEEDSDKEDGSDRRRGRGRGRSRGGRGRGRGKNRSRDRASDKDEEDSGRGRARGRGRGRNRARDRASDKEDEEGSESNRGRDRGRSRNKDGDEDDDSGRTKGRKRGKNRVEDSDEDAESGQTRSRGRDKPGKRDRSKDRNRDKDEEEDTMTKKRSRGIENDDDEGSPRDKKSKKVVSASELSSSRYKMFEPTSVITINKRGDILSPEELSVEIAEREDSSEKFKRRTFLDGKEVSIPEKKKKKKKKKVTKPIVRTASVPIQTPSTEWQMGRIDSGFSWSATAPPTPPRRTGAFKNEKRKPQSELKNSKATLDSLLSTLPTEPQFVVKRCERHKRDYVVMMPSYTESPLYYPSVTAITRQPPNYMEDIKRMTRRPPPRMQSNPSERPRPSALRVLRNEGDLWIEQVPLDHVRSTQRTRGRTMSLERDPDPVCTCSREDPSGITDVPSRAARNIQIRRRPRSSPTPTRMTVKRSLGPKTTESSETTNLSDSQLSEEPDIHIHISRPKRPKTKTKPKDEKDVGDSPPRKTKKGKKSKTDDESPKKGRDDDEVQAYMFHTYQGRKGGVSQVSFVGPWKALSLDTAQKCVQDDEKLMQSSTASFENNFTRNEPHKPEGVSDSCPLPTLGHTQQEAISKTRLRDKPYISSTTIFDYQSAESLLSSNRVHQLSRVLKSRKVIAYPSLVLVALALITGMTAVFLPSNVRYPVSSNPSLQRVYSHSTNITDKDLSTTAESSGENDVCDTAWCQEDGAYLKELISWDLNPCDDFYRFVCSRWRSSIRETHYGGSVQDDLVHLLETKVMHLLQRSDIPEELSMSKAIFKECLDFHKKSSEDWGDMLELLWMAKLDGFPFTSTPDNISVWGVAARLLRLSGTETLLSIRTVRNPYNRNGAIIAVGAAEPLSPFPGDVQRTTGFYNAAAYVAMKTVRKEGNASLYSLDVANFAARLELLSSNRTLLVGPNQIDTLRGRPELMAFVSEIFTTGDSPLYAGAFTDILLLCPDYLNEVLSLMTKAEMRAVLNYFGVRLMVEMSAFSPSSGTSLADALAQHLYGASLRALPRWKLCVRMTERATPLLFLHAVQIVTSRNISDLRDIVHHLEISLDKLGILGEESRREAWESLNQTRIALFHPSWLTDRTKLKEYVSTFPKMFEGKSLRSFYNIRSHSFYRAVREDPDNQWLGSAFDLDCRTDVDTIYVPTLLINVTLLNLSGRFELPYAGTRIFRCLLRLILRNVRLSRAEKRRWWPDLGHSYLGSALVCIERYGIQKTDSLALLESTAALEPAVELFLQGRKRRFSTLRKLEVDQLFFVYYARGTCLEGNVSAAIAQQVNIPLWNNRLFQEMFRCSVGTRMNPSKKCPLWRDTR
ncbi:uncharacterized protein LOC135398017 [Ornithodoros turicata]|uniref:uncharacterized protein LOC135398017 n=1 Tax=Ornithodoros turicata TaxID=34597 RepID=UPI0031396933